MHTNTTVALKPNFMSSLLLKLSKRKSPHKLFTCDCITLYGIPIKVRNYHYTENQIFIPVSIVDIGINGIYSCKTVETLAVI